ncbi:MAG: hypothetical protein JSS58_06400 [Proteobacteria bacterium]|nr:hypothetical protein [Pseudomonadota bacterium]
MPDIRTRIPLVLVLCAAIGMLLHGPIAQLPHYHAFADQRMLLGLPHAADVLSNLGFLLVAAWGWRRLDADMPNRLALRGWRLFLLALALTSLGSGWYHLAPDNARLIWDRLPIALACAGLLAAMRAETKGGGRCDAPLLALAGIASVLWWQYTEQAGKGDLRPYLLLQTLPLVLIPLWQWIARAPRADRLLFGAAIGLYVAAKIAELQDSPILALTGILSGHTLKHLLATLAAGLLVSRLAKGAQSSLAPAMPSS